MACTLHGVGKLARAQGEGTEREGRARVSDRARPYTAFLYANCASFAAAHSASKFASSHAVIDSTFRTAIGLNLAVSGDVSAARKLVHEHTVGLAMLFLKRELSQHFRSKRSPEVLRVLRVLRVAVVISNAPTCAYVRESRPARAMRSKQALGSHVEHLRPHTRVIVHTMVEFCSS